MLLASAAAAEPGPLTGPAWLGLTVRLVLGHMGPSSAELHGRSACLPMRGLLALAGEGKLISEESREADFQSGRAQGAA